MTSEIRLFTNSRGREKHDHLADLYSILVVTEHLERAYIRDAISSQEYTPACQKLISHFKTALSLCEEVTDIHSFIQSYHINCPAAVKRLVEIGVPATIEHASASNTTQTSKYVAETVQLFITLVDALKLNLVAVDQIHPLLSDLIQSLNQVILPPQYQGKQKVKEWLITLNQLKASDEITPEQVRQLTFDLDSSLAEFHRSLS